MTDDHALPAPDAVVSCSRTAAAVALLPIISVIAIDPWGLAPHGPLRWAAVTATLLVALVTARRTGLLPRAMVVAWAVLLLALAVATAAAIDPVHAVIGTPDRRLGILSWVGMAVAFAVGTTISSPADRRIVIRGSAIAGCLLALGAGADTLGWLPDSGFTSRVGGSYGQPAYLAAAATLLIPMSVALAADAAERTAWRVTAAASAVGATGALLASGTRGAWLGMAAGAVPLLVRFLTARRGRPGQVARTDTTAKDEEDHPPRPQGRRVLAALGVTVLLVAGLLLTDALPRARSGLDISQGTAAGRLAEWTVAGRVIADRPLLGTGPEGYRIAFGEAVDPAYGRTYGREVIPDRAHNSLLDVTATGGVVAGAAWAMLLAGVVLLGWRGTRADDPVQIGAGIAVIAYAAQQQLLFPLAEIDPVWWVLVGLLASARPSAGVRWYVAGGTVAARRLPGLTRHAARPSPEHADPKVVREPWSLPLTGSVRVVAVLLLGVTVLVGALGVIADRRMAAAAALARPPTTQAALVAADRATALRPDDIRLWFAAARIATRGDRIVDVDAALDRMARGRAISPRDPALLAEEAALLLDRARRSGLPDDLAAAIDAHRELVAADPANPSPRIGLATALAYDRRFDEAAAAMADARDLDPDADGLAALRALLGVLDGDDEDDDHEIGSAG